MREAWASFTPEEWEQIREGGRLGMEVPEIRARTMNEFSRIINVVAEALARRTGRAPDDLRVRVLAGAVIGVMMSVFLPEHLAAEAGAEIVSTPCSARSPRRASTRRSPSSKRACRSSGPAALLDRAGIFESSYIVPVGKLPVRAGNHKETRSDFRRGRSSCQP